LFKKGNALAVSSGKIDNMLGPNTSYSGTIKSDENLRIDCIYQGRIETAGNVVIGPSAKVLADIVANAVQVWGAVRGNITAQGPLEILPTGRVWGDIRVLSLSIDEGGVFRGRCTIMGNNLEPLTLLAPGFEEETLTINGKTADVSAEHTAGTFGKA
jgi:cytoskeletal protein CcmA (bactofilin family)